MTRRILLSLAATVLTAAATTTITTAAAPAVANAADAACVWASPTSIAGYRTFCWKDHMWAVKDSGTSTYGPGTNYWSPSTDNVWVDSLDNLHLKITKVGARWYCAEVIMVDNAFGQPGFLGYGTYRWTTASHVATLDPNVVLGLFQWDDQSDATTVAQGHREIDIELSRWGKAGDHRNGQYVLEPYDSGPLQKFVLPDAATNTFQYTWAPGVLDWSVPTASPATYHYAGGFVPDASGQQQPRMNLWLNNSKSPKSGKPVEVVLSDFTFIAG